MDSSLEDSGEDSSSETPAGVKGKRGALRDIGEYDLSSVMQYGRYADSKNGRETIKVLDLSKEKLIGNREFLSIGDVATIRQVLNPALKNATGVCGCVRCSAFLHPNLFLMKS